LTFRAEDYRYMARALTLADQGRYTTHPNPRVGCVLVAGGQVVGEGWHRIAGGPHAEIEALEQAGRRARGATVYLTLEPCSHQGRTGPCAPVLATAGVARVVAAMEDPNPAVSGEGLRWLREAGAEVQAGLLEDEARRLNAGFIRRMSKGVPRIIVKIAASLDGRTAMASGESRWITGAAAREDVQRLRASCSAILTGIGTLLADDPSLTVRSGSIDTAGRQPLRVVADSRLRTPATARMLTLPGHTLLVCAPGADGSRLSAAGAELLECGAPNGRVDLSKLMGALGQRECNDLLVEAGPVLCGALLSRRLVDELVVYLAPHLMGDSARGMFSLFGLEKMADRVQLQILDTRQVGDDLRIRAGVRYEDQND
jgi:diaminohydroxyphosphoribosylaminopyrimidine deaminase/5-amino-6-(5-phosphoribosylamino)uracil reductase